MFVNKLFTYFTVHIPKNKKGFNVKSSTYYFQMKTKILGDLQICINIPLKTGTANGSFEEVETAEHI